MDYFNFMINHEPAASTNRSAAVQTAPRRSCLKKQSNDDATKSDRSNRHVQFDEVTRWYSVDKLKDEKYLWDEKGQHKKYRKRDLDMFHTDAIARQYLLVHDRAYVQLNGSSGTVQAHLQQAMVRGLSKGYRALESHSDRRNRGRFSKKVVDMYKMISIATAIHRRKGCNFGWQKLREYSERLSRDSRQWAAYMGLLDAFAAADEYVSPSLVHRIWKIPAPPVVTAAVDVPPGDAVNVSPTTTPKQHQKSLVYKILAVKDISMYEEQTLTFTYIQEPQQREQYRKLPLVQRLLRPNAHRGSKKGYLWSAIKRRRGGRRVDVLEWL